MKKINIAYEVLSDPQKKQMYDQGYDPEHPEYGSGGSFFDLFNFDFSGFPFGSNFGEFDGNGFHYEFHFG